MYIATLNTTRISSARALRARRSQLRASPRDPICNCIGTSHDVTPKQARNAPRGKIKII